MNKANKTIFIKADIINQKNTFKNILLMIFLILFLSSVSFSIKAAPDGYCQETISDFHVATWVTNVDYDLLPNAEDPEAIKITVDIFFTTDGFGLVGSPCQPDPECDEDFRYVNAWIDWDGDYDFDPSEQVLDEELFWYDENYQDWLINTYEGDPLDIMDILLLPKENFTGKSIRWLTFDSFAGGMGIMTVAKVIPIPDNAQNNTWIRVNYGWLYDPKIPCELYEPSLNPQYSSPYDYWEYGEALYEEILIGQDLSINSSDITIMPKETMGPIQQYDDFKDSVLTIKVHNEGAATVKNVEVLMSKTYSDTTKSFYPVSKIIDEIDSGEYVNVSFEGNFDPYRIDTVTIEVDPENNIKETREKNNKATTHKIEGMLVEYSDSFHVLPKTKVIIEQKYGSNFETALFTFTDEDGIYKFWTNTNVFHKGKDTRVNARLEYSPTRQTSDIKIYVINESDWMNDLAFPAYKLGNNKSSVSWTLQKDQDYSQDIFYSENEGGLAYHTLVTVYNYHEKQKTAPSEPTLANINDDDVGGPCVLRSSNAIHLPAGKGGTTRPSAIAHEFTHIVEYGWLPTYYGHHPLVPVEEGSCHWGSCISRNNSLYEFPSRATGGYVIIDVSKNNDTCNSTPAPATSAGCREEFQIAGTMWDLDATLVWNVLRYGYGPCNPLWPSTPVLFYNAYKEIDANPSPTIKGIFQSHAYNTSLWPGKDGQDPDYFTEIFSDQGVDADSNGRYETLQVTVELNMSAPGNYILTGVIGGTDVGSSNTTSLESGVQLVNLSFFGENIYESQQDGPYNLSFYLYGEDYTFLDIRTAIYDTQYYSYTEFERPTLLFTGNQTAYGTDSNGDGIFDQIIVDLELNLTESSYVKMYANLYSNDSFIDNCWGPSMYDDAVYEYLESGVQHLLLYFNGESIYASGLNGSYELRTYLSNARTLQLGSFNYTDFAQPPAFIDDLIEESGIDEDGDGFYDTLNVNISVNGLGTYSLNGHLYNETGAHIITTHQTDGINLTQSILLSFDGKAIRDQQRSGVYTLSVDLYDMNGFFLGWQNYTLSTYDYNQFELSSEDVFEITCIDYGIDNHGYGRYENLCIDIDVTSQLPGMYQVEGYLYTDAGVCLCFNETIGFFDATVETISLLFNGQRLGSSFYNGSYTLDLIFKNSTGIVELIDVYSTSYYSYGSFESSYVLNTTDKLYSYGGSETVANRLGVTAETYSTIPRYVTFKARLLDSTGELIAESGTGDIWAYKNDTALILFDGGKIYDHGIDGPYTIVLRLYGEKGVLLDSFTSITNYYDHSLFLLISLTGTYNDYGIDLNSDNVFDYLVIEADVHASTDGFCTITGTLEDATGETITTSENTLWLPEGLQILPLYFNGTEIKNHGVNGPYYLKHVAVSHIADVTITDYVVDAYVTSVYDHNDFTLSASILPNKKPVSIASGPKGGTTGESLLFNASASYDPEGQLLTYSWEFGDGTISTLENPTHTYSTDGIYTVNLTVNDSMQDSYPQKLIVSIGYPVAETGGPYMVYGIQPLTFNGSASFDPEGGPLTYSWEFGDGSSSTEANPTYTYATEGVYTVTLTVHDGTYEVTASTTVTVMKSLSFDGENTDEGYDEDGDGLYEYLLVETDVTNYMSQNISVEVTLIDSFETILSYGLDTQYLNINSYKLSIYFDGPTFFENMVDGPYYVEIIIRDESDEILDALDYATTAYAYTDFQYNTKIGDIIDYRIDVDTNGFYDYLAVDVTLINYVNRDVVLHGELFDSNGTSIVSTQEATTLTGNTTIQLLFDGKTINSHGENGPYTVVLIIKNQYGQEIEMKENSTFAYHYTDFEEQTWQIWTVDDDNLDIPSPPADFSTIQEAIDAATDGDEILVYSGTYYEHINLNKTLTLSGIGLPVINAGGGNGINITDDECLVQEFFIRSAYISSDVFATGINISSSNNTIINNTFFDNYYCVYVNSYGNSIMDNIFDDNEYVIHLASHSNVIAGNFMSYNEEGISLAQAHNNTICNNTLTNTDGDGISLVQSHNNLVINNNLSSRSYGVNNIILSESDDNIIKNNTCLGNGNGIVVLDSSNNVIYLNTLGNRDDNGHDNTTNNNWSSTNPVEYTYESVVYTGFAGNCWEGHFSTDADNDGIYDTPYTDIEGEGNATDYYPLVGNWPPTAEANGPYQAEGEQNITFDSSGSFDPEEQSLTYFWDFDDGNSSTEANPVYAYNLSNDERGKFYAYLTVSDGVYIDTDTASTVKINYPLSFPGGPYYGIEGVSITLDGSASYDPLHEGLKYYWYPADGSSGGWESYSTKSVRYDTEGEYRPYLQVKTDTSWPDPAYYSACFRTTVYINDTDPVPDFTCSQQNGQAPLTIDFMDLSDSYDGITLWEWDFDGDGIVDISGNEDTERNPSFMYVNAGSYTVNLTVYEDDGDMISMIKTDYIIVNTPRPPITIYVPDDYPSIQEAIDAGTTMDRDTIIVRDGVYKQNTLVNKELIIRSENGSECCQLFPEICFEHMITIISDNVTIDGFFMNGTRNNYYDKYGSLYVNGVDNVTICNNWINDSSYGIMLKNARNITIINNAIINNHGHSSGIYECDYSSDNDFITIISNNLSYNRGSGLQLYGDYHTISNNTANNNADDGLQLYGDYHTISNNTANNNGRNGVTVAGDYNVISGNIANRNGVVGDSSREDCGLRIYGTGNIISNNTMNSNYEYGLFLPYGYNIVHDNIMQENAIYDFFTRAHNTVYSNTGSGDRPIIFVNETSVIEDMVVSELILLSADYSLIQNVTVAGSETLRNNGIYARSCDYVEFINVTSNHNYQGIDMTPTFGYSLLVGQEDNIFTDCSFKDNRRAGIRIGGDRNKIENCDISFNQNYGVYFYECSEDSAIINSTLNNNSYQGIHLRVDYTIFNISNNTIDGNSYGIYCTSGDYFGYTWGNVTIAHNMISNNTNDAIRISEGAHRHNYYIHDNIIIDNDDCGLSTIVTFANIQVVDNTITGNKDGVYCENNYWYENAQVTIAHNTISNNNNDGIRITKIDDHTNTYIIYDNVIENNTVYGIYISPVSGTLQIVNNSIIGNANGIYCNHGTTTGITTHVTIGHNIISDNDDAINITDKSISHNYLIHNTIIENNAVYGIFITSVSGTLQIVNNMITENNDGIYCENSICDENAQATITHNIISHNNNNGIRTNDLSIQFLIYDNIIVNNSVHDIANNSWNITKTSGPNIIGGPYIGGNYWSDYAGVDLDEDGIGDTDIPFNASGKITTGGDHHPLVMSQELYLFPIQDQMMHEDTIRSVPVCALGTDTNAIILSADGLPSFGVFSDEGNGIGIIDFMPDSGDRGDYMIIISATDGINTATGSFNLLVLATDYLPVASYIFKPQTPTTLQTIYFNSTSTDPDGALVIWTWDMGDGTHCYGEQIQHQYTAAATYEVCLTVEDNNGFTDTICQSIVVEAPFIDVGVNTIISPEEGDEVGIIPVQIEVQNYGNTYETDIIVNVKIGNITGDPITLLAENFSSLTTGEIPTNWTRTHANWGAIADSNSNTGGSSPEMRFRWNPTATGIFRLSACPIDTVGCATLEISFKHFLDHYDVPYTLHVQSSTDGANWSDVWSVDPTGNIGPETINILLDAGDGVGSDTFYLAWTFEGDSYNVDYWYIDDILVRTPPTSVNVYNQTINIDLSFGEQLIVDSFPDWTGMTAGSYYIETCVQIPGDVNPNNNCLFEIIQVNSTSVNQPPIADAGGPYSGLLGEDIQLDGSGSVDSDGFIVVYDWDLNDDGQYDDASGVTLPFSWLAAGSYPISLRVTDDGGATDTDDTTVEITASNQLPVAVNDSYVLFEDSTLLIAEPGILWNDSDADHDSITAILIKDVSNGSLTLNSNGSFTYIPKINYFGSDNFTYKANDGKNDSNTATVDIIILAVNDPPIANEDYYMVAEDSIDNSFNVLENDDIYPDINETLEITVVGTPDNGGNVSIITGTPDSILYKPAPNFYGFETFTYSISDGNDGFNTTTVNVTVTNVNDPPIALDDTYNILEDSTLDIRVPGILGNDSDVDNDILTAVLVSNVSFGTLNLNSTGSFTYIPNANFKGVDYYTYYANDSSSNSNIAIVNITVESVNDAPALTSIDDHMIDENTTLTVLLSASDPDDDVLSFLIFGLPSFASFVDNGNGTGFIGFMPGFNDAGFYPVIVNVSDGNLSVYDVFNLTVNNVNRLPIAEDQVVSTDENTPVEIVLFASDIDGDPLTFNVLSQPPHGVLTGNAPNLTYTPDFGYSGLDNFTFKVFDGINDSNIATVTVTVEPSMNQAPVAYNDSYALLEDTVLTVPAPGILGNDTDADGDSLSAILVQDTIHGLLVPHSNGSFSYTPTENYFGSDCFSYKATDGMNESNTAIVNITVFTVNDPPTAYDDVYTVAEDSDGTIFAVLENDIDNESDSLTIASVTQPMNGSVANNGYNITYAPNTNYCGPDSFTYTISDGNGGIDTAMVTVMVTCVNDPPTAYDDVYTVAEGSSNTILSVLANDAILPDTGETLSIVSVDTPNNGGIISIIEGIPDNLSYTPAPDFFGIESFNYTVTDEQGGFDTAPVTITVTPVNDPPVAYNDSYTLQENSMLIIPEPGILGNDTDVDLDFLTAVLATLPNNGLLLLESNGSFSYEPDTDFEGIDSFTYQANDSSTHSNIATVYLIVQPVNTAPVLAPITDLSVDENDAVTVLISASDADDDTLTLSAPGIGIPSFAVFTDNGDGSGSIVFTPGFNDTGVYQLILTVSDGILSDSTVFNITVNNVNRPPLIPSNPTPLDGALDCDVNTDLSWIGGDPDSDDTVTYDVYFGETNQLSLLVNNQTDVTYDPGTLNPGMTFYWQVISWDNHGAKSEGPIWNFTTAYTANISIQKTVSLDNISWHDTAIVDSGEVLYWNITVENTGDVLLLDVMVTDELFTTYEGFPLACNEKRSFYYTTISSTDLNNTASVEGTDPYRNIISDTDWASVFVTVAETIDLELSKTASLDYASDDEYEGLSHGFWKNHEEEWVGYVLSDMTGDTFDIPDNLSSVNDTLRNALRFKGGKGIEKAAKLLMVQSVAALLNTAHPGINYPLSESALISSVNDALASLNRQTMLSLKDTLDEYNNLGGDLKDCCKNNVCTITYIITLNNNESTDATGINVTDILPENLTYISSEATLGSYDVTTGIWNVEFLQAYGNSYLEIVVETNVSGSYSNTAEVTYANEVDSDSIPNNHDASEDDQDTFIVEVILGDDCD